MTSIPFALSPQAALDAMASKFTFILRDIFANLTPLKICKILAVILALHMIQVGLWLLCDPSSCIKAFGLRLNGRPYHTTSTTSEQLKTKSGLGASNADEGNFWTSMFACREVGFGLLILIFAGLVEWKSVDVVVAVEAGLLATTDGVAIAIYGRDGWKGAVMGHGVPAVVLGAVASGISML